MTELAGAPLSSLLETLPGIANVLRSPVADAIIGLTRAAARVGEFRIQDAEELVRYGIRRSLLGAEEGERLLAEVKASEQKRAEKAAEKERGRAERAAAPKPAAKAAKKAAPARKPAPKAAKKAAPARKKK